ncbi:phage holin family protein [Streptomyces sp. NPDC021622]|uniref:phage holin family protein n=1 Tax=Streptomyces sp. NPDC021622 TaxID=3155013 RepID=UPI0033F754D4
MNRFDHMEHLDKALVDELAWVARETIRDELREQTRKQRRTATLYAAAGAFSLYAGAALALAIGLALALGLPDWVAALITAVILGAVAHLLRGAARPSTSRPTPGPSTSRPTPERAAEERAAAERLGGIPSAERPPGGGLGGTYPPVPPGGPEGATGSQRPAGTDPEAPHRWTP